MHRYICTVLHMMVVYSTCHYAHSLLMRTSRFAVQESLAFSLHHQFVCLLRHLMEMCLYIHTAVSVCVLVYVQGKVASIHKAGKGITLSSIVTCIVTCIYLCLNFVLKIRNTQPYIRIHVQSTHTHVHVCNCNPQSLTLH